MTEDDGGPLVMLTLLRFTEGGRERYAEYARRFAKTFLKRYGAEVIYRERIHEWES